MSYKSPNCGERIQLRPDRAEPSMIILHYTGMQSAKAALERLCDPASEVSAHYVVEEDGRAHQLVADERRAWHAGRSYWGGLTDINSASIGIEIVNKGHEFGYEDFPRAQINAVAKLCKKLMEQYDIRADMVLGHADIAPDRKTDPGERFPWKGLAEQGIGLWPSPTEMDFEAAADLLGQDQIIHDLLADLGYNPEVEFDILIEAFHRHYFPEKFLEGASSTLVNAETIARILALVRARNNLEEL